MSRAGFLNSYTPSFTHRIRRAGASRESYHELCSPAFYRELESYLFNEGFADDLDPADADYIDGIRRGTFSPIVSGHHSFIAQEQAFWTLRYGVEPGVTRRIGTGKIISAETEQARQARREHWQKLQAQRKQDKAMTAAELAREQAAWDMEQERLAREREQRLKRTMEADREWERSGKRAQERQGGASHPSHGRSNDNKRPTSRHYVPEWKQRELYDVLEKKARQREERAAEKAARKAAEQAARKQEEAEERELQRRQRAEAARREAQRTIESVRPIVEQQRVRVETLKYAIMANIRGSLPCVWTIDMLIGVTGCREREVLMRCCGELVSGGYLRAAMVNS